MDPVMVIGVPTVARVRLKLVITGGGGITVNRTPLLATPPTVTTTFPVVAPVGTPVTMLVALQLFIPTDVPLNVTVLVPSVAPKFVPVMVTGVPTGPEVGLSEVMLGGGGVTVNATPLLATPPTVTTIFPVLAPEGTTTLILDALQLLAVPAETPLNVTLLVPCEAPKFAPVMVTAVPTCPDVGLTLAMFGPPPVPPAARKATICMTQGCTLSKVAVAL